MEVKTMDNKRLEKWKLKTKGIFHKIVYDEFWFYIDDLMKENKRLTNNWSELEELIIDEINDAQNELNIILQGDDLDYKNECTKEFNCIKNALEILLDKMKEIKERKNENI
jgi:hypothetical protein